MGEKSIAKSFKGILRISHILDLVKGENDELFNPTYYSRPKTLMNIAGNNYESIEKGFRNPKAGMDGTISRYIHNIYNENKEIIGQDELLDKRVPLCDSMGNYLNWNVGFNGVTIGSNEEINSNAITLEEFQQNDIIQTSTTNNIIWQEKYFPILEAGEIVIGLQNKEYPTNKFRINQESGIVIENSSFASKLIVENKYDKSFPVEFPVTNTDTDEKYTFVDYNTWTEAGEEQDPIFRTIYSDNQSNVREYDVFMYRQDDYDCYNYDYILEGATELHKNQRGNADVLSNYDLTKLEDGFAKPIRPTIDCNVGIANLSDYVTEMVKKYMNSVIVEVPTGMIINQFCSLDKWYAANDTGQIDDMVKDSSYPGHRPSMMAKRNVGMTTATSGNQNRDDVPPGFVESTILGASKKINRLINPNFNYDNLNKQKEENEKDEQQQVIAGYYKEIIPLYKRDYVLCDGSVYAIYLFPKNFDTAVYPNRRPSLDRFLDLFFAIGYQYTTLKQYVNRRMKYRWSQSLNAYKPVRAKATASELINAKLDSVTNPQTDDLVTAKNVMKLFTLDDSKNGTPSVDTFPVAFDLDRHAVFVEDFITIQLFEKLYETYSLKDVVSFPWTTEGISNWLKTEPFPEKYRLNTFIGDKNSTILSGLNSGGWIDRTDTKKVKTLATANKFVMELPYYNFTVDNQQHEEGKYPIITLGREVRTFGDPIKFYDQNEDKWVIIEAYKLPQVQHLIDLFTQYPTPDALIQTLSNHHQYSFQVPNLTNNTPTFIGSSGVQWADNQHRKVREIESWTCSYSQKNYMHRHALFVEGSTKEGKEGEKFLSYPGEYSAGQDAAKYFNIDYPNRKQLFSDFYKGEAAATGATNVAAAAYYGGCYEGKTFTTGNEENINYIWNELGSGSSKYSYMTIVNEVTTSNGMLYPIFQAKTSNSGTYHCYPTGKYRPSVHLSSSNPDLRVESANNGYDAGGGWIPKFNEEIWNSDIKTFNSTFVNAKHEYDRKHWYGWEHDEDPRFATAEPNRGRTSVPTRPKSTGAVCTIKYENNSNNFTINAQSENEAEWFAPENIKMLPLIKL